MRLDGAVAMVKGAGSSLGRATAERLAPDGARVVVVVVDLGTSSGPQVADAVGGVFVPADVTDEGAVTEAATGLGALRMLVNCAGIGPAQRTLGRGGPMPLDFFAKVVPVNLIGTFNVVRLAAAAMAATDPTGRSYTLRP